MPPFICFPACSRVGHYHEMGGHMGATKTYANAKTFYYWPGMFDWIWTPIIPPLNSPLQAEFRPPALNLPNQHLPYRQDSYFYLSPRKALLQQV